MRRASLSMVAVAATMLILPRVLAQAPAAPAANTADPFPAGTGHDLVLRVCSGCHDPAIAAQQRLTPDGWKELVNTMASRGAAATDAELDQITAYLAKSFPAAPAKS